MTEDIFYWYSLVVGSLAGGGLIGLIPLLVGEKSGKRSLGIAGFLCCIVGSFILGLFLSLPCCIGFTIAILVLQKKKEPEAIHVHTPGQPFPAQSWSQSHGLSCVLFCWGVKHVCALQRPSSWRPTEPHRALR